MNATALNSLLRIVVLVTGAVLLATTVIGRARETSTASTEAKRPNILFFLVDDMGTRDTSVDFVLDPLGRPIEPGRTTVYRTPAMERLAARGRRFSNAHACTVCTPTRVSIMTGQHAARLGITTWTHPQVTKDTGFVQKDGVRSPSWRMQGLDVTLPTLPRLLKEAGYATIHCGKAHFGPNDTAAGDPKSLGFDVNIAGHGAGGPGSYSGKTKFSAAWRNGGHDWDVPGLERYHDKDVHLTEALTLELKDAITAAIESKRPFFAYMAHYAVHAPFEIDARFAANYPDLEGKALAFATMVEGMDKSLGDLLDHLESLGVAEETLVVFYSDNGSDGPLNRPLRGKKGTRFEGGTRVPLIVAWARAEADSPLQERLPIEAASVSRQLVTPEDFLPTLCRITGVDVPKGATIDGSDVSAAIRGIPGTHAPPSFAIHFPHRHNDTLYSTWLDGDWKLIYEHDKAAWQLTNVALDPDESENLVASHPSLALAMAKRMIARLDALGAQWPVDDSGQPTRPDLAGLEGAAEAATRTSERTPDPTDESSGARATRVGPLPRDDLDLASMCQPIDDDNLYRDDGYYTWCNSILRGDDGTYHLFYVRWPKERGFYGWLTHSEIARAVSDAPAGPYRFAERVLPCRGAYPWNAINAHNIKSKRFEGRYYLYFIATNAGTHHLTEAELVDVATTGYRHPFWRLLRDNQRTGVAVADTPLGPWTVLDRPIVEPAGPVSTVSVNPAVWRAADGTYRMIFKGDHPVSRVAQAVAIAKSPTGPFEVQKRLVFERYSEDASVWHDSARALTYAVLHDRHGFIMIASEDGIAWRDAKHARVHGLRIAKTGGGFLEPSRFERPSVFVEDGKPRVLSGAAQWDGGKDACIVLIPLH
ncbi:MAG: sulfatase-like hydrolase/transferase [Planctomycetes bacterium]|nr:sulfatase-like hydrolase/transferase [Planctomycetota bacterium]MCB9918758.1 sulfatase-like hydrolase/transferase [Planctomycetota bacterium]